MSWSLTFFLVHIVIRAHSRKYIYNGDYQLSQSNWEATCLFYYDRHLASIHNAAENTEARTTMFDTSWIGLSDFSVEDIWVWTDSTPWNYLPNNLNGGQDCVAIDGASGDWDDDDCTVSYYGLCGYPNGFTVLNDKIDYVRTRGDGVFVGYIDILDEVYISFYITFLSWPSGWGNILHFGDDDTQRYPTILIQGTLHYIRSSFGLLSNANPTHDSSSGYELDTEYHYTLHQTQRHLTITFDAVTVYDADTDSHPIVMNRALYLGSPWYDTFSATLRNLQVTTGNSPENTFWNYLCDDDDSFAWRPIQWTLNDGAYSPGSIGGDCSLRQRNNIFSDAIRRVAWLGTNDVRSLTWTNYKIEMSINIIQGNEAGIILRANGADCVANYCGQYYEVQVTLDMIAFRKIDNGYNVIGSYNITHVTNTSYLIRVEASGSSFAVYENNVYLKTWTDTSYGSGSVGFYTNGGDTRFSKMRITFPNNQQWYTVDPTKHPTVDPTNDPTADPTSDPTEMSTESGGNLIDDANRGFFLSTESLLLAIFVALVIIILLCCWRLIIHFHRNRKENVKNIKLGNSSSDGDIEENATDFADLPEPGGVEYQPQYNMPPMAMSGLGIGAAAVGGMQPMAMGGMGELQMGPMGPMVMPPMEMSMSNIVMLQNNRMLNLMPLSVPPPPPVLDTMIANDNDAEKIDNDLVSAINTITIKNVDCGHDVEMQNEMFVDDNNNQTKYL